MKRMQDYFLSSANIGGCVLALLVLLAYLLNWIGPFWWVLAGGAYLAGSLPFALRAGPRHIPEGLSTSDALDWLRHEVQGRLPTKAKPVLADIIARVDDLMPRLKEMEQQGLVEASSRALLKQTITRLLPDAVEAYLRLPAAYAAKARFDDGKSAEDLLTEQLMLLQEHVYALEENLLSADVNQLLANGRFLQEKFRRGLLP